MGFEGEHVQCFAFHKSAIGNAFDTAGLETPVGYDEEQAYSCARASAHIVGQQLSAALLTSTVFLMEFTDDEAFDIMEAALASTLAGIRKARQLL